jgi:hypothetical protein
MVSIPLNYILSTPDCIFSSGAPEGESLYRMYTAKWNSRSKILPALFSCKDNCKIPAPREHSSRRKSGSASVRCARPQNASSAMTPLHERMHAIAALLLMQSYGFTRAEYTRSSPAATLVFVVVSSRTRQIWSRAHPPSAALSHTHRERAKSRSLLNLGVSAIISNA